MGILILVKLTQEPNACLPISVTSLGILILIRLLHLLNALSPISVTLSGISIFFKLLHFWYSLKLISVIETIVFSSVFEKSPNPSVEYSVPNFLLINRQACWVKSGCCVSGTTSLTVRKTSIVCGVTDSKAFSKRNSPFS